MKKRASRRSIVSVACLSRPNADVLRCHPLGWSGVSVRRPKGGAGKAEHEQHPILPSATVQSCQCALCRGASLACAIRERATEASPGRRYRPPVVDESQVAKEQFAESRVAKTPPPEGVRRAGLLRLSRLSAGRSIRWDGPRFPNRRLRPDWQQGASTRCGSLPRRLRLRGGRKRRSAPWFRHRGRP